MTGWASTPDLFPLFAVVPGALPRVLGLPAAPAVRSVLATAAQTAGGRQLGPKKGATSPHRRRAFLQAGGQVRKCNTIVFRLCTHI